MRRVAVLFAIDTYPRRVATRLFGPTGDARDLSETLRSPRGGSLPDNRVLVRLNADATWDEFGRILDALAASGQWDEVIIYLAGHGGELGFYFHGGEVSYERIGARLRRVRAKFKLALVDACLSGRSHGVIAGLGGIEKTGAALAAARMAAAFRDACPGARVISAADRDGLAPDERSMTQHLLDAVRVAVPDRRAGSISAQRAFDIACGTMFEELGWDYPWPESSGDLSDFPLAVSDFEAPFGRSSVTVHPGWASDWGTVRHVPLSVGILGRRFLDTGVRVSFVSVLGRKALSERLVRPASASELVEVCVRFNRRAGDLPGSRLVVDIVDELGRSVGPQWTRATAPSFTDALAWQP